MGDVKSIANNSASNFEDVRISENMISPRDQALSDISSHTKWRKPTNECIGGAYFAPGDSPQHFHNVFGVAFMRHFFPDHAQ